MQLPGLSSAAERIVAQAVETSSGLGHRFLGVEHLFLGLASDPSFGLGDALRDQDFELGEFEDMLRRHVSNVDQTGGEHPTSLTPRCHSVFRIAAGVASNRTGSKIEPAHILEAILREGRSVPVRFLMRMGVDLAELQSSLSASLPSSESPDKSMPLLSRFGRDLTALALAGRLSPLIGRAEELSRIAQVLLRKNKNNPVLVGEAGVGKTAVVEGLAQWLLSPDGPAPLRGRRVIELSMGAIVAGTKYRGEFEERLLGLVSEVSRHPEVVLFLDEIHTLVGAGASSGESMDGANILKPALARGELRCIGATTIEEYRRFVERDAALERRFDPIMVGEPSPEETAEVLRRLAPALESHHHVVLPVETLQAAIELTVRHIPDRRLPDKALDVLDQSCARKRLASMAGGVRGSAPNDKRPRVTPEDIVATVAQWTGIPPEHLSSASGGHWLDLENELRKSVFGQDDAVHAVSRAVLTAKAGLASGKRPLGVFLFLGPTGVGKTQLAKCLAASLFGDESRLIRFDMSEFMEPHSVAKLIGAPPGYVGHEREGLLISAMRTHRHAVVLFDEVEKAHPDVFDLFLQIFDDGRLSGAHGKTADFTQAIVILTSNLSLALPSRPRPIGYNQEDANVQPATAPDPRAALLRSFRPELVNRLDEVVVFRPLSAESLREIVRQYVKEIEDLIAPRGLRLVVDDEAYLHFLRHAQSELFGAREIRRVVDSDLRRPLAEHLLAGPSGAGTIRVVAGRGGIEILRT